MENQKKENGGRTDRRDVQLHRAAAVKAAIAIVLGIVFVFEIPREFFRKAVRR